jgi:hypothetical protein
MALVTESMDVTTAFGHLLIKARRKVRHVLCRVVNGGHELYRARTATKLYQECLLCGYETHGWTIDRRDRQLQLVNHATTRAVARR